jgi:hypothetical protein
MPAIFSFTLFPARHAASFEHGPVFPAKQGTGVLGDFVFGVDHPNLALSHGLEESPMASFRSMAPPPIPDSPGIWGCIFPGGVCVLGMWKKSPFDGLPWLRECYADTF